MHRRFRRIRRRPEIKGLIIVLFLFVAMAGTWLGGLVLPLVNHDPGKPW